MVDVAERPALEASARVRPPETLRFGYALTGSHKSAADLLGTCQLAALQSVFEHISQVAQKGTRD